MENAMQCKFLDATEEKKEEYFKPLWTDHI